MRILKRIGVILSMAAMGAMMLNTTAFAKINIPIQNGRMPNARVIENVSPDEVTQKLKTCRVYDPNRMNYTPYIRDYANQFVASGYMVFDLKSVNKLLWILSIPDPFGKRMADDGIYCIDSYDNATFETIISKMSQSDYESYYLDGRRIQSSKDYTKTIYDNKGRLQYSIVYNSFEGTVYITHYRYNGGPICTDKIAGT